MQIVDHADVSCLHNFFIKDFGREKEKRKYWRDVDQVLCCLGLVWLRYTWRNGVMMMMMIMVMMMIGSLVFVFLFVLLVHVHVHEPFGHIRMIGCIDDDMNNKHRHFFGIPFFFFLVLSVPHLGTRVPPTRYTS